MKLLADYCIFGGNVTDGNQTINGARPAISIRLGRAPF